MSPGEIWKVFHNFLVVIAFQLWEELAAIPLFHSLKDSVFTIGWGEIRHLMLSTLVAKLFFDSGVYDCFVRFLERTIQMWQNNSIIWLYSARTRASTRRYLWAASCFICLSRNAGTIVFFPPFSSKSIACVGATAKWSCPLTTEDSCWQQHSCL